MKRIIFILLAVTFCLSARAQEPFQSRSGEVDIFMGVDLNYRDIYYNRQYDLLINLTPGVKWYFGKRWTAAAQVLVPVFNQYGDRYKKVRPDIVTLSREINVRDKFFMKVTGGLFSNQRYGLDLKMFYPLCEWFALEGQAGLTGKGSFATEPKFSYPKRVTGTFGADIYLTRWNTQLRGIGGHFASGDYGVYCEGMRHFRHTTVGLYAQWSDYGKYNGGFRVTIMLPPYRRSHHKVNFRPASNFLFSHNIGADPDSNKMYRTDPEQNDRDGWFSRGFHGWGTQSMNPDYTVR